MTERSCMRTDLVSLYEDSGAGSGIAMRLGQPPRSSRPLYRPARSRPAALFMSVASYSAPAFRTLPVAEDTPSTMA